MLKPPLRNIEYFFETNSKDENDHVNSCREDILLYIFNNDKEDLKLFTSDEIYGHKWSIVIDKLNDVVDEILTDFEKTYKNIYNKSIYAEGYDYEIVKVAGRKTLDFILKIYEHKQNKEIKRIIIEFKNNSDSVQKLPQFYQKYESTELYNEGIKLYNEYYYDEYVDKQITNIKVNSTEFLKIKKEDYLKQVNKNDKLNNGSFFKILKDLRNNDEKFKNEFDENVKESIHEWLKNNGNCLNISFITNKFSEQMNKIYIMWKCDKKDINKSKFYKEEIDKSNLSNLKFDSLKCGKDDKYNSIVLTDGKYNYNCLLRWKNDNGIRGTAWQFSLKNV
jgi:hypothetical protein